MADQFSDLVRRVWHGFDIRDGEAVTVGADDIIAVTVGTMTESFDLDGSSPPAVLAAKLADRFQTILMEARQALLPACPRHGDAHPLVSAVVEGRAVWICPQDDSAVADILP